MEKLLRHLLFCFALGLSVSACRSDDEHIIPHQEEQVEPSPEELSTDIKGFFLLNEGNMD